MVRLVVGVMISSDEEKINCEGNRALEQAAQTDCKISGDTQTLPGHFPG